MILIILKLLPLFSAFTWASSGLILKKYKIKNLHLFPLIESSISLIIVCFIVTFTNHWPVFFSYTSNLYLVLISAYGLSVLGTLLYIESIKRIELGIVFTLATSIQIALIGLLDKFINLYTFNSIFILGSTIIITGVLTINYSYLKLLKKINQNKIKLLGIFSSLLSGMSWGGTAFLADKALNDVSIFDAALFRTGITLLCLIPINIFQYQTIIKTINLKELKYLTLSSLFITSSMLIWIGSLKVNSGSWTTILSSSAPIFALTAGYIFLKEKLKQNELLGVMLCLSGILLVIFSR
jgi:drug/metabolite transporter (DMT)-like permease